MLNFPPCNWGWKQNTPHHISWVSVSLPQQEMRKELGVEVSPHQMESLRWISWWKYLCGVLLCNLLLLRPWELIYIPCFSSGPFLLFHTRETETNRDWFIQSHVVCLWDSVSQISHYPLYCSCFLTPRKPFSVCAGKVSSLWKAIRGLCCT